MFLLAAPFEIGPSPIPPRFNTTAGVPKHIRVATSKEPHSFFLYPFEQDAIKSKGSGGAELEFKNHPEITQFSLEYSSQNSPLCNRGKIPKVGDKNE